MRNPKSILQEIKQAIEAFENGQIKHFISIAGKGNDQFALKDEALMLCELEPNYLVFRTFSKEYFIKILKELNENNYKQIKNCISILLRENRDYLTTLLTGLKVLLNSVPTDKQESFTLLEQIDKTTNFLFTELLDKGFSKEFLYRYIYAAFVNNLNVGDSFINRFEEFEARTAVLNNQYTIIFRIDTSRDVNENIRSTNAEMTVTDNIEDVLPVQDAGFGYFKTPNTTRKFIRCNIISPDHFSALKKAKAILAENLDVLNLGFSDKYLNVNQRALVIDNARPDRAQFQNSVNFIDGKYNVTRDHYLSFITKVPVILANPLVTKESKEKIKSAIRYLRLGNQSTEVEHKFINYWIGLEYLFSNYESSSTINRIKDYFVVCHSLVYVKRNLSYFYSGVSGIDDILLPTISNYNADPMVCLANPDFYREVAETLLDTYPLIAERANNLSKKVSLPHAKRQMEDYIKKHQKNLEIHLTRIYRLRNEIVHDAATNTNNENVAANLRYYLTFALNGIIDFLCQPHTENVSIEDYFTISEIHLGNIQQKGFALEELLKVPSSIDFIS